MNRLSGRTVLIAGAAGGRGRAGAVLFAAEGAGLALCDVDETGLKETEDLVRSRVPDAQVLARTVDMRVLPEIEAFVAATEI